MRDLGTPVRQDSSTKCSGNFRPRRAFSSSADDHHAAGIAYQHRRPWKRRGPSLKEYRALCPSNLLYRRIQFAIQRGTRPRLRPLTPRSTYKFKEAMGRPAASAVPQDIASSRARACRRSPTNPGPPAIAIGAPAAGLTIWLVPIVRAICDAARAPVAAHVRPNMDGARARRVHPRWRLTPFILRRTLPEWTVVARLWSIPVDAADTVASIIVPSTGPPTQQPYKFLSRYAHIITIPRCAAAYRSLASDVALNTGLAFMPRSDGDRSPRPPSSGLRRIGRERHRDGDAPARIVLAEAIG